MIDLKTFFFFSLESLELENLEKKNNRRAEKFDKGAIF